MSIVNLFVFSLAGVVFGAWFGFRRYARKFLRTLLLMMAVRDRRRVPRRRLVGWLHGEGLFQFLRANWVPVLAAGAITGFALAAISALIAHLRNREYVSLAERLRLESKQEQLSRRWRRRGCTCSRRRSSRTSCSTRWLPRNNLPHEGARSGAAPRSLTESCAQRCHGTRRRCAARPGDRDDQCVPRDHADAGSATVCATASRSSRACRRCRFRRFC
jgi:hypothetical protein